MCCTVSFTQCGAGYIHFFKILNIFHLFTVEQVQAQYASINASIQSGVQNISGAIASLTSGIADARADYQSCVKKSLPIIGRFVCGPQAATAAVASITKSVTAQINAATQIFTQVLTSAFSTGPQVAAVTLQSFVQTAVSAASQFGTATQQAFQCISRAANSSSSTE